MNAEPYTLESCRQGKYAGYSVEERYARKKLVEEAVVHKGIFAGEYKRYSPQGALVLHAWYKDGMLHGPSMTCFSEVQFVDGKEEGEAKFYYPMHALHHLFCFKNGLLHGVQKYYYETGTIKCELFFSEGVLEGKAVLYFPDGTLYREVSLIHGKRDGLDCSYDKDGLLVFALEYKEGRFVKAQIEDTVAKTYGL